MRRGALAATVVTSLLAALTTWLTVTSWSGFAQEPRHYLVPILVGCVLVAVTGAALRVAGVHWGAVLLAQLVVVGLWLNHEWAASSSVAGWLPTVASIRADIDVLALSMDAAQSYPAPVSRSVTEFPPVLVLVGTLAAVLVDFLACGRHLVPLAGLPLLAMYTAPVSLLRGDVSWVTFVAVAICFLALLAAEQAGRLHRWGRDLGVRSSRPWLQAGSSAVWPSARRIGLTATGLAVVVPLFIPTLTSGVVFGSGGPGGGNGNGVNIRNPLADLKRDLERGEDVPLFSFTTSDPAPAYVRYSVLDEFDGSSWRPTRRAIPDSQRADGEVPAPEGLNTDVSAETHEYEFSIGSQFRSFWLPAPFPVVRADVPGDWRYDLSTMDFVSAAEGHTTAGLEYDLTALDVKPTLDQLLSPGATPTELFRRYTSVNRSVPDWVGELAEQVTAKGESRFERAVLLQNWFREPHADEATDPSFTYDLEQSPTGNGVDELTEFLRGSRTGYCEQFAAAMALMARELQIPARVAVGFLRPERGPEPDSWVYSSHDQHAWPELYFEGVGWTRFEPTPSTQSGGAPGYTTQPIPHDDPSLGPTASAPSVSNSGGVGPTDRPLEDPQATGATTGSNGPRWPLLAMIALPLLALLLVVPRLARVVVRRRRWRRATTATAMAEAAWAELRDSVVDLRLPWDDRVTVRTRARDLVPLLCRHPGPEEPERSRVIRDNPVAAAALDRIVLLVERARYSRSAPESDGIRDDVAQVVEALRIGVEPTQRRRADWLPASLLTGRQRRALRPATGGLTTLTEPGLPT